MQSYAAQMFKRFINPLVCSVFPNYASQLILRCSWIVLQSPAEETYGKMEIVVWSYLQMFYIDKGEGKHLGSLFL